ncbi:cell wall-binding repeat-containing protein [Kineococcus sp. LSe6-4]|uniref:Cell wall-binding repeat-containing protein n=1 Tax=Kineococcus halophytocola TaxID=3234027 RepID=A0ABV4H536_9ACTN
MTAATSRLRRRGIGAGVAALVGLSGLGLAAMPAQAAAGFDPSSASARLAGVDRYDTAAKAALAGWTTSSTVIVANGEVTGIDALAASYLAGVKDAPILLTQRDSVPSQTAAAIASLNPSTVIVLGDTNAVSASTYSSLVGSKTGQRIDGPNRFATAVDVMTEAGVTPPKTVFLARGDQYGAGQVAADALAAGPAAFKNRIPVLLTNQDSLPAETLAALNTAGVTKVYVLGNSNAVSDAVYTQVDNLASVTDIERIQGSDRTATAAAIANEADFGFNRTGAALANGFRIDALAAGPVAGRAGSPILLTEGTVGLGVGTESYLRANASTLTRAWVFGDANSVTPTIATAATTAADGGSTNTNQRYTFAPTGPQIKTISENNNNAGVTQYTVSGLGTDRVNLALVTPESVRADGTFAVASGASTATLSPSAVGAITVVNGVGNTSGKTASNITPVNGSVTFTVTSDTAGSAVPVVFSAADNNATLSVSSAGIASEAYGVGGQITWLPTAAEAGNFGGTSPLGITAVDKTAGYFVAGSGNDARVFRWKTGDTFQRDLNTAPTATNIINTSQGDFLERISAGDAIAGSYSTTGASNFILTDLAPVAPATVTAAKGTPSTTSAVVSISDSTTTSVASYNVYRAAVPTTATPNTAPTALSSYTRVGSVNDATPNATNGAAVTFTDNGLTAATRYFYAVTSVDSSGQEGSAFTPTTELVTDPVAAATTPRSSSIAYNDGNANGRLDSGDVVTVTFDQAVTVGSTWAINLIDGANNAATISNSNATATTNAAGTLLTVNLTASPQVTSGAGPLVLTGGNASGVEVLTATGIGNATGNWNVAGSGDRTIAGTAPAAVPASAITITPTTIDIAVPGSGTNNLPAGSNLIRVYNANGVVQAYATVTTGTANDATGVTNLVTTPGGSTAANLPAGDYLVTYQNTTNGVTGLVSNGSAPKARV